MSSSSAFAAWARFVPAITRAPFSFFLKMKIGSCSCAKDEPTTTKSKMCCVQASAKGEALWARYGARIVSRHDTSTRMQNGHTGRKVVHTRARNSACIALRLFSRERA
eukprot:scaffold155036_cov23-Tisochrysis_lutea.AAC.5